MNQRRFVIMIACFFTIAALCWTLVPNQIQVPSGSPSVAKQDPDAVDRAVDDVGRSLDRDRAPLFHSGLTVCVQDSGGNPLAGAMVFADGEVLRATDTHGKLALGRRAEVVGAVLTGYAPTKKMVSQADLVSKVVLLQLAPEALIHGCVRDCFEHPVAGAEVEILLGSPVVGSGGDVAVTLDVSGVHYRKVTKTNSQGMFTIGGLAQGEHRLTWRAEGHVALYQDEARNRYTWKSVPVGPGQRHEENLLMGVLLLGAIDITHAHGLDPGVLRWMLGIGLDFPASVEPMSSSFPELVGDHERELSGSTSPGFRFPVVAVATRRGQSKEPRAAFRVSFRDEAEITGSLSLVRLPVWRADPAVGAVRVVVGQSPVPTGQVRIHTPYEVDVAGVSSSVFGSMPLRSNVLRVNPETFVVNLPVGDYTVAPSRRGLLEGRKRLQRFSVVSSGLSEVAIPNDGVARVVVHAIDRKGGLLKSYNLKMGDGERGTMIAGRSEYGPVVEFMELGSVCHLELWATDFSRKVATTVQVDQAVVEVRLAFDP